MFRSTQEVFYEVVKELRLKLGSVELKLGSARLKLGSAKLRFGSVSSG